VIRMAENLLASIDLPESEVMLEVQILEITRTQMEQIGIQYPTAVTLNPTALAGDPLVLADLGNQDSTTITITPVPITIDLAKEVGASHLLASPRIRVRNHEKAEVLIGQRVPVISNSVTPTANGQSVVTGTVEYVDVGLTLKVEPTIHLDGTVAINLDLEVSNIIREIFNSTSGTLAYQIGTRNTTTVLRLRSGETQILSGLIQSIDRETSNRVPGLGDMPILGRLFSSDKTSDEKTEIVMSITPRIVRAQARPASEHTEFWYGTESSLRSAPLASSSSPSGSSNNMPSTALSLTGATSGTNGSPGDANVGPNATADATPPKRLTLDWDAPGQVSVGDTFNVALTINSATELASLRTQLRFDQAALELSSVEVGNFIPPAVHAASQPAVLQRAGRVQMNVASTGEAPASGSGSVMVMHFKALLPRPGTSITVQQFSAKGVDNLAVPAMAPRPLVVVVGQ
jgi:general secretion pathway protein D